MRWKFFFMAVIMFPGLSLLSAAAAQATLGDAVDAPGLTWTTGGDADWFEQSHIFRTGGSSARSGAVGDSQMTFMETTVTGPASISFYWSVSSEADNDHLIFSIDGVEKARVSGHRSFADQIHRIGAGTHTLRWAYVKNGTGSYGSDCGWVDQFEFQGSYPLADALDDSLFTWTTGGDEVWFGIEMPGRWNSNEAQSGVITDGQSSYLETTVSGPGLFTFTWRVSSEELSDYLVFYIDGAPVAQISGSVSDTLKAALVGGSHTLRWEYVKDGAGSDGDDYGSVDRVTFSAALPLDDVLNNFTLTFTTGGDSEWLGVDYGSTTLAQCGVLGEGQSAWMETTVVGPGFLSFRFGLLGSELTDALRLTISGAGEEVFTPQWPGGSSSPYGFPVPAGPHTVRWTFERNGPVPDAISTAWIDEVAFRTTVDLGEAVDDTLLAWTTGGDADWVGQKVFSGSSGDAAQSGIIDDNQSSWIGTTVTGPGILQYIWKTSSQPDSDLLSFTVDGVVREQISGAQGSSTWPSSRQTIPTGVHDVRWVFAKDGSGSAYNDCGYLDWVRYGPGVSLDEALDSTGLVWNTGGDAEWVGQEDYHETRSSSGDAAESGTIADGQSTWIETDLEGPGVLSFYASVSAEEDHDFLIVTLDGVELRRTSTWYWNLSAGEYPFTVIIPPGSHRVRWTYTKDAAGSDDRDHALLDEVTYSPLTDLNEALDNTGLVFTTGGDAAWGGQTLVSHFDGDAAAGGWIGVGETSWVETTVSGPGLISFYWKFRASTGPYHYFKERRYVFPAGNHTFRWTYSRTGEDSLSLVFTDNGAVKGMITDRDVDFDHSALLDKVVYAPGVPLETVLHNPAVPSDILVYTTGGDARWQGLGTPPSVGGLVEDLAVSGWVEDDQSSWLETTVQGPGELSFSWAVSSQIYKDHLKLYLDGAFKEEASGGNEDYASNFYTARQAIPSGSHTVRWEYAKDGDGRWGADWAKIDWIAFNPGVPLADALDGSGIIWNSGGDTPWVGISRQNSMSLDLTDAAQSGLLAPGETSWLETTVTGPGVFSFWNSKQFGNSPDDLSFLVDGVDDPLDAPGIYWGRNDVVLTGGSHTLRWEYTRSDALGMGVNAAVIDMAHWEPTVSIAEAVDNAGLAWITGGVSAPYGQTTVSLNGGDAVRTGWAGGGESWLETTVEGPGYLAFSWKTSEGTPSSHFAFLIDGVEFHRINDRTDWERVWLAVPAGTHTLRWLHDGSYYTTSRNHGHDCGWLDNVVYIPPIPLQEALDNPALTWATGGDAEWFGEIDDFVYGGSAAQSGYGGSSWIETAVTGPQIVSFDWKSEKTSSHYGIARLSLSVDGAAKFGLEDDTDWERGVLPVPSGNHTLRWRYTSDRGYGHGVRGSLDHVEMTAPVPLGKALDNDYLIFTTGSGREWLGQKGTFVQGGSAAQSTAIGDLDSSSMEATVYGPGYLSFLWKVSSYYGDYLRFAIDGASQDQITGEVDWTEAAFFVPPGAHVVRWEYSKNDRFTGGDDAAWVDRVVFTPDTETTVCPVGCDETSIQTALENAVPMQTILVRDGHYTGPLDFLGKIVTLVSENGPEHTVIDAGGAGSAVTFAGGEGPQSILDGFTVTGGAGFEADGSSGDVPGTYGGGIYGEFSSPTVRDCIISGNTAPDRGGGMYFYGSAPLIARTVVSGNSSENGGGAFFNLSDAELVNVTVSGNSASSGGGGLSLESSNIAAVNSTIVSNAAAGIGGGIKSSASSPLLVNTILWGNDAAGLTDQLWESEPGSATILYSDVEGGDPGSPGFPWPGAGNLDADPEFVESRPAAEAPTAAGNYRLTPLSPCIDAATGDDAAYPSIPDHDREGHGRRQGAGHDMGADEHVFRGDWNGDGMPDLFWRHGVSGANYLWQMNGPAIAGGETFPTVADTDWTVGTLADFDGDGRPDILWRNGATGANYLWYMDGPAVTGGDPVNAAGTAWVAAAAADFNLDGKQDLLWRNTLSGANHLWYMDGADVAGNEALPAAGLDWSVKSADDFNGDGKPDILWRNTATGDTFLWYLDGNSVAGGDLLPPVSLDWTIDGTADFDGDGMPDICWRNYGNGKNYLWYMDGALYLGGAALPAVGDPDWHIEQ